MIRQFLQNALAAEGTFERQLRSFASENDDGEVQALFAAHADLTRSQHARLAGRLSELDAASSDDASGFAPLLNVWQRLSQPGEIIEERTLNNIASAYTIEAGECAMYEILAVFARGAGDTKTEALAREIQTEERQTAESLWHFLPSRSKIAFNMLTVQEIDPAVETKIADDRLINS